MMVAVLAVEATHAYSTKFCMWWPEPELCILSIATLKDIIPHCLPLKCNFCSSAHHLETKIKLSEYVHVTSLMAASGFLWIGTSIGLILIYRIPHLEGIPIISGKPYLAMDGHKGAVRVLLPVKTKATISSSRVGQFLSDEQRRFSLVSQPDNEEEEGGDIETLKKNSTLMESSKVLHGREGGAGILEESEEEGGADAGVLLQDVVGSINEAVGSGEEENGNEIDDRSPTPPFPLSPPPTTENGEISPQVENQNNGIPADDSGPQYQPLEEEDKVEQVNQEQQVLQDQQVKLATEPEELISGDEVSEEVTIAAAAEDATPQDKVEETDVVNGSTEEKLVEIEEREKLNGNEPSYENSSGSTSKNEEIFGVVRQNETEHLNNGHVDESGIYSAPVELDRIPRPQRAKKKKKEEEENIYSIPHEILPPSVSKRTVVPAGYENPSALNDKGVFAWRVCVTVQLSLFILVHG